MSYLIAKSKIFMSPDLSGNPIKTCNPGFELDRPPTGFKNFSVPVTFLQDIPCQLM